MFDIVLHNNSPPKKMRLCFYPSVGHIDHRQESLQEAADMVSPFTTSMCEKQKKGQAYTYCLVVRPGMEKEMLEQAKFYANGAWDIKLEEATCHCQP